MFDLFKLLEATIGLRIDESIEEAGLDLHEHGTVAYPEFVMMLGGATTAASVDARRALRAKEMQLEARLALHKPYSRPVVIPEA